MLTLHHLRTSRSSRVIWLLEALGLGYELVIHEREPDLRAPDALRRVHPLGKAPALVDGDLVLAESASILRHVAERHGGRRFMPPAGSDSDALHTQWLDYAEGSLMTPLMVRMIGGMTGGLPPGLDRYATGELGRALDHIGRGVETGPFLMGEAVTLADMQMSYCMAILEAGGLLESRPSLAAYWDAIQADPDFRKTIAIGGPLVPRRA